jgi:hypothetical protein
MATFVTDSDHDTHRAMPLVDIDFDEVVSVRNWQSLSEYYQSMPSRTQAVVESVVEHDERLKHELRNIYLPKLLDEGGIIDWRRASPPYIRALQQKELLAGRVVAVDATLSRYESLSLVGAQIAISRVGYHQKSPTQYASSLMYWGTEVPQPATAQDIVDAMSSRGKELKQKLPSLVLDAISKYMERRVLLETARSSFKFIQGPMFPHAMLSGLGYRHTMLTCFNLIAELIEDGNYATIVSKDSHRDIELMGLALQPGEYIVIRDGKTVLNSYLYGDGEDGSKANYTRTPIPQYAGKSQLQVFEEFRDNYGHKVVQGVLRAHAMSRPYVFYCNRDQIERSVHLLLADAQHTGPRGFPMLLDLADQYCSGAFKASEYTSRLNSNFARATGGSGIYQSERSTRD